MNVIYRVTWFNNHIGTFDSIAKAKAALYDKFIEYAKSSKVAWCPSGHEGHIDKIEVK